MKFANLVTCACVATIVLAVSGCSGKTAKCSDEHSLKEVKAVIESNLMFSETLLKNGRLKKSQISGVRTTENDEKLDTYMCEATYKFELDNESQEYPVRYELSYLEDEKRTRVAVYDIRNIDESIIGSQMLKNLLK